jgi:hypothetical protein
MKTDSRALGYTWTTWKARQFSKTFRFETRKEVVSRVLKKHLLTTMHRGSFLERAVSFV